MKIRQLCALVLGATSVSLHAFIYEARILRKWDAKNQRYHYFYGYSDFHDKMHQINDEQIGKIKQVLSRCDKDATKVIVEALNEPGKNKQFSCGNYCINSKGGVLGSLGEMCRTMNMPMENVEYRYCRVTALGPVLNNLSKSVYNFPSTRNIKIADLIAEFNAHASEVNSYRDGSVLGNYYSRAVKSMQQALAKFDIKKHEHETVAMYLDKRVHQAKRLEFLKEMLTFDSMLLDLKIIHSVVNTQEKHRVVVFAGGAHVERVAQVLRQSGYEEVFLSEKEMHKEYDLTRCSVGSSVVDGKYCEKPKPVAHVVFDQLL